jgi:hypothetical protein
MRKLFVLAGLAALGLSLGGCAVVSAGGAVIGVGASVVGAAAHVTGAVVGGAVHTVTGSGKDDDDKKDS